MKNQVTVIREDKLIIVDGVGIEIANFTEVSALPKDWRIIQWNTPDGDIETQVNKVYENIEFEKDKYNKYVKPFVDMYEEQKTINETPPILTIEDIRAQKKGEIQTSFLKEESLAIPINDINYHGGYESATKLDSARRLAQEVGLSEIMFFDTENIGHNLTMVEATGVTMAIAGKYQNDFAKYQGLKTLINNALTKEELEAITWES